MGSSILPQLAYPLINAYRFVFRPKSRGVKCVIGYGGSLLLVRHSYGHKQWTFPGGGIERGETPEQAARREMSEEVSLQLTDVKNIGEFTTTAEYIKDTVTVFAARSESANFTIDGKEILEARWFLPNELPEVSQYAQQVLAIWRKHENSRGA